MSLLITKYERQVHDIHIAAYFMNLINREKNLDNHNERRIQRVFRSSANSTEEADIMYIHFSLWRRQLSSFDKGAIC